MTELDVIKKINEDIHVVEREMWGRFPYDSPSLVKARHERDWAKQHEWCCQGKPKQGLWLIERDADGNIEFAFHPEMDWDCKVEIIGHEGQIWVEQKKFEDFILALRYIPI